MTLLERIAEIEGRAAKATEGPWTTVLGSGNHVCTWVVKESDDGSAVFVADFLPSDDLALEAAEPDHRPNMAFVQHARTDIPALCRAVRVLAVAVEGWHDHRDAVRRYGVHDEATRERLDEALRRHQQALRLILGEEVSEA